MTDSPNCQGVPVMPKRRWRVRGRREQLTEAIRRYAQFGDYGRSVGADAEDQPFSFEAFLLSGYALRGRFAELRDIWDEHGAELLADWLRKEPGTRPHIWWCVQAREPRRCLSGVEYVEPFMEIWRTRFGIPAYRQLGHFEIVFESEAAYLDRRALLSADERRALDDDDFEPEIIRVDADTLEDIVSRRARKGNA